MCFPCKYLVLNCWSSLIPAYLIATATHTVKQASAPSNLQDFAKKLASSSRNRSMPMKTMFSYSLALARRVLSIPSWITSSFTTKRFAQIWWWWSVHSNITATFSPGKKRVSKWEKAFWSFPHSFFFSDGSHPDHAARYPGQSNAQGEIRTLFAIEKAYHLLPECVE